MSTAFQRIGVAANLEKERARAVLGHVLPALTAEGFDVFLEPSVHESINGKGPYARGIPDDCDLLIAVGGDGTILTYAREFLDQQIPILGLKGGTLGFLTEGRTETAAKWLREGRYGIQERMRVSCTLRERGTSFSALNDVVVHGSGYSRMVTLRVSVDGKLLLEYAADGVIIATPTGSTAYSVSAGGPLVEPTVKAIVLTPLSPHSMRVRPLVVDASQSVVVDVAAETSPIMVTIDGQIGSEVAQGERIEIRRDPRSTRLVVPDDYDFFALLREKL